MSSLAAELKEAAKYLGSRIHNYRLIQTQGGLLLLQILTLEARFLLIEYVELRGFRLISVNTTVDKQEQIQDDILVRIWEQEIKGEFLEMIGTGNVQSPQIFETLDSLLFETSPLFSARFHQDIFEKLSKLGRQDEPL